MVVQLVEGRSAQGTLEDRITAATLRCVSRWGLTKTTLDDIAREAGCSRATVYRAFPGGKDILLLATFTRELSEFFASLGDDLERAPSVEDLLVVAVNRACRTIVEHEALQYLIEHEPEVILPYLTFDGIDPLLEWTTEFAAPYLARFLPPAVARETAEWVARLVVSYGFEPTDSLDLTDIDTTRRFIRTYVLPGLEEIPPAGVTEQE